MKSLRKLAQEFLDVAMSGDEARLCMVACNAPAMARHTEEPALGLLKRCAQITERAEDLRRKLRKPQFNVSNGVAVVASCRLRGPALRICSWLNEQGGNYRVEVEK